MDMKRKAARGIAVLAVALAAGHLVQNMGDKPAAAPVASANLAVKPAQITPVAAGPDAVAEVKAPAPAEAAPLPAAPLAAAPLPVAPPETAANPEPVAQPESVVKQATAPAVEPTTSAPAVELETAEAEPVVDPTPTLTAAEPLAPIAEPAAIAEVATNPCDVTLDLMAEPNALIGITLIAPCNPNQRVVLRQGGLAVTAQTTSTGALFTAIPAMETDAQVEVSFVDGTKASAGISVPDLSSLQRFGVQWQGDDAFQVHAFEGGATYGQSGHVSAADPHRPVPGLQATGGFLTLLGDATTENPLLAEVYTFPADPAAKPEVIVEAAVTEKTCGREMLAETLTSTGGSVFVTDLTLAMPACDAIGDFLVLKNLVLDLNMAAAN